MDADGEAVRVLNEFPLIIPYPGFLKWEGFIQAKDLEVLVEILTPNYPSLKDVTVKCPADVYPLLAPLTQFRMEESSLVNLLRSMSHALKSKSLFATEYLDLDKQKLQTLITVMKELNSLGGDNVVDLNHDEMTVTLCYEDSHGDQHEVTLQFHSDYPKTPVSFKKIDLPPDVVSSLEASNSTFEKFFDNFKNSIEELIPFWEMAKQLESECWVIDPEVPQRRDTHRRIFLTTDLSVSVVFNPSRPREMPEIKFFGCISAVEQKRTEFMSNLEKQGWDFELSVASNIKSLLNVDQFPGKPTSENTQDPLECLICASSGLEQGALAQKWCDNDKCPSVYHRSCLYRWFDGLQTAKQFWDYICGPCPYCKVKIWCPIKEDAQPKL